MAVLNTNTRYQNLQINQPVAGPNVAAITANFLNDATRSYQAYNPGAFKPTTPGTR